MTQKHWQKIRQFLSQFPDMSLQLGRKTHPPKFSLENMRVLASQLGHPENNSPSIHVAGTNGKGSLVSICASVLRAAGYKVGQYTSPHYGESLAGIKINGKQIESTKLLRIIRDLEKITVSIPELTLFEIESMIAFLYFSFEEVDIAIIEVGLGGLLDATNIIDPILTVITSIDLEHQTMLGSSLAEIAGHKAGIIHAGAPLILATQKDEARAIILDEAKGKNVDVVEMGVDVRAERGKFNRFQQTLQISLDGEQEQLSLGLLGRFQIENAALAYSALKWLEKLGFPIKKSEFQEGFLSVRWPGRFEMIEAFERIFILDAAHTPLAAKMLSLSLEDYFPNLGLIGIFGISNDKDPEKILAHFPGRFSKLIATQSAHPRAMEKRSLKKIIVDNGIDGDHAISSLSAIKKALEKSEKGDPILVFGSVFLIEELRAILINAN